MDNPSFTSSTRRTDNNLKTDSAGSKSRSIIQKNKESPPKLPQSTNVIAFKKHIGYYSSVGILVGSMIGSGIFISPKGVLQGCGSVGLTIVVWTLCGVFALLGALSFSELGTLIPTSGGEYIYMLECFAYKREKEHLFWGPLIPFLHCWTTNIIMNPANFALQGLAWAEFIVRLFSFGCDLNGTNQNTEIQVKLLACLFIVTITLINCYSVKLSTRMVNVFTVAKVAALIFIIVCGIIALAQGTNISLKTGFDDTVLDYDGIANAFFSGLFAYSGWGFLNDITSEMDNPKRDFLKSMVTSVSAVIILYTLVNISYFVVLSKEDILASNAVSVGFAEKTVGMYGAVLMIFSVATSIFGAATAAILTSIRSCCVAAKEGHLVDFLSFLHMKYLTPSSALIFNCLLTILMMPWSNIGRLLSVTGFLGRFFTVATMIALLIMRRTRKHTERPFTVPIIVPYIVIAFSLFLLVMPFIKNPKGDYIYAVLFLIIGFFVYVAFVYYKLNIPGIGHLRTFVQKLLLVLPQENPEE